MKKVRPASAAGKFYTSDKAELSAQLDYFSHNNTYDYDYRSRAIIVPHAGYVYSGQLASEGFQYLDKDIKNIFIIAPSHYVALKNPAISAFDKWSTPLGEIEVNQEMNNELVQRFGLEFEDEAFKNEHAVEVQVPFIQKIFSNAKIIPILAGPNYEKITKIIATYYPNPENAFVISSDLSHFYNTVQARKMDNVTAEMIEMKDIEKFSSEQACGAVGVLGLVNFAKNKSYSLIRVGMINSGDVTGDTSSVVGYGSWILCEGAKNTFIKKYFSDFVINTCKNSILAGLNDEAPICLKTPAVFNQLGASFVTLEKNGDLRGCIGSIIAHRPLIEDLIKNSQSSAFSDPRFQPLRKDEFDDLSINVSLLSEPEKMHFDDEADLLSQIVPFEDGIIIKERSYQAVYLPSVWEQLPEKTMFLNSLKVKAGLPENYFSQTLEAYRYTTEYIKG